MKDTHRTAASTRPRNVRIPGSPEWCYQTMTLMAHSYQGLQIDHRRFEQYLNELREHRAWEKVPVDAPYGSEEKMLLAEIGRRIRDVEKELAAAKQSQRSEQAKAADAADQAHTSRQGERTDFVDNNENDVNEVGRPTGNSREQALRRLRKDRPDIHARVLAGKITPHAGMIEAGFRKRTLGSRKTPYERVLQLWPKLTAAEKKKLRALP